MVAESTHTAKNVLNIIKFLKNIHKALEERVVMSNFKAISKNLLYAIYGFLSAVYTPSFMSIAFNLTKGAVNNPEGSMFVPFGFGILLAILLIDILIITKMIKGKNMTKSAKVLAISLFVVVKIIGLMLDQNGWKYFIHDFSLKFLQ